MGAAILKLLCNPHTVVNNMAARRASWQPFCLSLGRLACQRKVEHDGGIGLRKYSN